MTTQADIAGWFDEGKKHGHTHLLVVCDTFDHEDYPVYASSDAEALAQYAHYNGLNMQRVMEVYDLHKDKAAQLAEHRSMHLPGR